MSYPADLTDELGRSPPARAALAVLEGALARRSAAEQGAFWHAIDLAYVSRKAPPEAVAKPPEVVVAPPDQPTAGDGARDVHSLPRG